MRDLLVIAMLFMGAAVSWKHECSMACESYYFPPSVYTLQEALDLCEHGSFQCVGVVDFSPNSGLFAFCHEGTNFITWHNVCLYCKDGEQCPTSAPTGTATPSTHTSAPTEKPTFSPTQIPTSTQTSSVTAVHGTQSSSAPTFTPTSAPTKAPTVLPTQIPTMQSTTPVSNTLILATPSPTTPTPTMVPTIPWGKPDATQNVVSPLSKEANYPGGRRRTIGSSPTPPPTPVPQIRANPPIVRTPSTPTFASLAMTETPTVGATSPQIQPQAQPQAQPGSLVATLAPTVTPTSELKLPSISPTLESTSGPTSLDASSGLDRYIEHTIALSFDGDSTTLDLHLLEQSVDFKIALRHAIATTLIKPVEHVTLLSTAVVMATSSGGRLLRGLAAGAAMQLKIHYMVKIQGEALQLLNVSQSQLALQMANLGVAESVEQLTFTGALNRLCAQEADAASEAEADLLRGVVAAIKSSAFAVYSLEGPSLLQESESNETTRQPPEEAEIPSNEGIGLTIAIAGCTVSASLFLVGLVSLFRILRKRHSKVSPSSEAQPTNMCTSGPTLLRSQSSSDLKKLSEESHL